jgi:hypothetical protein
MIAMALTPYLDRRGWGPVQMWARSWADVGSVVGRCGLGRGQMRLGSYADVAWVVGR